MSSIEPIRPEGVRVDPARRVEKRAGHPDPREQPPDQRREATPEDDEGEHDDGLPHVDVLV